MKSTPIMTKMKMMKLRTATMLGVLCIVGYSSIYAQTAPRTLAAISNTSSATAALAAVAAAASAAPSLSPDAQVTTFTEFVADTTQAMRQDDADLWQRVRRGFALDPLASPLVQDQEQWYASRQDYIRRFVERGSKYMYHIVEELERRKMPTEIVLLPIIESAFNPQAYSRQCVRHVAVHSFHW